MNNKDEKDIDYLSKKQFSKIRAYSDHPRTEERDSKDINRFLEDVDKESIRDLSRKEASLLIDILKKRPGEFLYPCGVVKRFPKEKMGDYAYGDGEECFNSCVGSRFVGHCPDYANKKIEKRVKKLIEEIENNSDTPYKCDECNDRVIPDKKLLKNAKKRTSEDLRYGKLFVSREDGEKKLVCYSCSLEKRAKKLEKELKSDKGPSCEICGDWVLSNKDLYENIDNGLKGNVKLSDLVHHLADLEKEIILIVCEECHKRIHQGDLKEYLPKK